MKGFFIEVTNNLLEKKHIETIGSAIWEFMWCLDKITKIDENGIGLVLGGKPIQLKDISKELGLHRMTISKHLSHLTKNGYINKKLTPYGIIISVNKAKKRFNRTTKPLPERLSRTTKPRNQTAKPNKTVSVDNTIYIQESFNNFYTLYPKRRNKEAAHRAWKKLNLSKELVEVILKDVADKGASEEWQKQGGQFIPYPASYLNGRRWEDEKELSEEDKIWKS